MQSLKLMSDTQAGGRGLLQGEGKYRKVEARFREALTRHGGGRDWSALEPALPELVPFVVNARRVTERLPSYTRLDRNERKRQIRRLKALLADQPVLNTINRNAKKEIYGPLKAAIEAAISDLDRRSYYKMTDPRIQNKLVACATILDDEGIELSGWLFTATALAVLELSGLTATNLEGRLKAARRTVEARKQAVSGN